LDSALPRAARDFFILPYLHPPFTAGIRAIASALFHKSYSQTIHNLGR
jgi:hypothetical protein